MNYMLTSPLIPVRICVSAIFLVVFFCLLLGLFSVILMFIHVFSVSPCATNSFPFSQFLLLSSCHSHSHLFVIILPGCLNFTHLSPSVKSFSFDLTISQSNHENILDKYLDIGIFKEKCHQYLRLRDYFYTTIIQFVV